MDRLFRAIRIIGGFALLFFMIGLGIGTSSPIPDHALVYLDDEVKTYSAPLFLQDPASQPLVTIVEARRLTYSPDRHSRDTGAFFEEGRSISGMLLEKVGILGPLPSRWNADGSWNY